MTVNGNGHKFNGQGEQYWDGLGGTGTVKPHPMMKCVISLASILTMSDLNRIKSSGAFSNVIVKNPPQNCFSFGNSATLVVSKVTVDAGECIHQTKMMRRVLILT